MSDKLEELKRKVERDIDNVEVQRNKIAMQKKMNNNELNRLNSDKQAINAQITQMIGQAVQKQVLGETALREQINDKLDIFTSRQQQNTEMIIKLRDDLADSTILEDRYNRKKKEIDEELERYRKSLENDISRLKSTKQTLEWNIQTYETNKERISKQYEVNYNELEEVKLELKKKTGLLKVKKEYMDYITYFVVVGGVGVVIGGIFGWGIFSFFNWLLVDIIWNFLKPIVELFL